MSAADLKEPITLTSSNGVLDILMIAKPAKVNTLPSSPTGWVYEICRRPINNINTCPASIENYYGGTRLQLERGDLLKIRLINQLPLALDSEHAEEPGREFLALNPTNLHTHGLLVSPHGPTRADPTYGDNVFVLTFNSANGKPADSPHMHSDIRYDYTDYIIRIPPNHPSGLFWFHPHAHGLALNQLSAGLAGIITIGHVKDYVCRSLACAALLPQVGARHIILKDTQLLPNGTLQTQEDPGFSEPDPEPGEARQGVAPGKDGSPDGSPDYRGGKWLFTLNGQLFPTIPVRSAWGEIWRITNTSGSVSYDLNLFNPVQRRNMIMQVVSSDGVSISPSADITMDQMKQIGGSKFRPEACPVYAVGPYGRSSQPSLCTRRLLLMPSSRVEVWVSYRNAQDQIAPPPKNAVAVLRTTGYQTGDDADHWPAVDLAQVSFAGSVQLNAPGLLGIGGQAHQVSTAGFVASDLLADNKAAAGLGTCKALPPGHMRRVFYAAPTSDPSKFGLAYEEIDEKGNVVGPPATDVTPFDPMAPSICLPLGPANTPAYERWQLVNVATEDHNFHMHQVKFRVLTRDEIAGTILPTSGRGRGIEFDNIPLVHAEGVCGNDPPRDLSNPIANWRAGLCKAKPVTVEIPFAVAGKFVYHCHILEHEDGGMMAVIQVVPSR